MDRFLPIQLLANYLFQYWKFTDQIYKFVENSRNKLVLLSSLNNLNSSFNIYIFRYF